MTSVAWISLRTQEMSNPRCDGLIVVLSLTAWLAAAFAGSSQAQFFSTPG
jgi:hypothetical protein